jgi:hypothetical protein
VQTYSNVSSMSDDVIGQLLNHMVQAIVFTLKFSKNVIVIGKWIAFLNAEYFLSDHVCNWSGKQNISRSIHVLNIMQTHLCIRLLLLPAYCLKRCCKVVIGVPNPLSSRRHFERYHKVPHHGGTIWHQSICTNIMGPWHLLGCIICNINRRCNERIIPPNWFSFINIV